MMLISKNKSGGAANKALLEGFLNLCESGCVPEGAPAGHKDGWGIIGFKKNMPFQKFHSLDLPISPTGKETCDRFSLECDTVLAHLRKASIGSVKLENCHPFACGTFAFAHNGSIQSVDQIVGEFMRDEPNGVLRHTGDTDSEKLFALCSYLASKNQTSENAFIDALLAVSKKVAEHFELYPDANKSFCVLASDGKKNIAMRLFNPSSPKLIEYKLEPYYSLFVNATDDRLAICSEPIGVASTWELIPNGELWEFEGTKLIRKERILPSSNEVAQG